MNIVQSSYRMVAEIWHLLTKTWEGLLAIAMICAVLALTL